MIKAEDLVKEAKEHGCDITMEEAVDTIGKMELSEDDLGDVTGGTIWDLAFKVMKSTGKQ